MFQSDQREICTRMSTDEFSVREPIPINNIWTLNGIYHQLYDDLRNGGSQSSISEDSSSQSFYLFGQQYHHFAFLVGTSQLSAYLLRWEKIDIQQHQLSDNTFITRREVKQLNAMVLESYNTQRFSPQEALWISELWGRLSTISLATDRLSGQYRWTLTTATCDENNLSIHVGLDM